MVERTSGSSSRGHWQWPFRLRLGFMHGVIVVLLVLMILSALGVISTAYHTRSQYARLQTMERQHDQLQTVWSRLLLEESTWSTPSRIENLARDRLEMHVPDVHHTRVMRP
ncbi:cell division protein FtsL [Kushneria avicenniae]|uniref:Cell division protein FtsL n=1 Tax=Kushneria avicenniae TaxID=402385 RepID=A0A1I1M7M4_9GAMM|nr:cell division protein FtsL [Kushneria avicenniae]SFC80772.1 cell division protein FtsL [Kushneria avicenniae]